MTTQDQVTIARRHVDAGYSLDLTDVGIDTSDPLAIEDFEACCELVHRGFTDADTLFWMNWSEGDADQDRYEALENRRRTVLHTSIFPERRAS